MQALSADISLEVNKLNDIQIVVEKLLQDNSLMGPFKAKHGKSYREDLEEILNSFIEQIKQFSPNGGHIESSLLDALDDLLYIKGQLLKALDEYLSGSAGRAYDSIENLLTSEIIQRHILSLVSDMKGYDGDYRSLFRVRNSESLLSERSEMFHIPFNYRHLVGTQRYSIAGVPCLYLGTSLYVCWQEMGTPDLNRLYLSRFVYKSKNRRNVKYLDFSYSLDTMKHIKLEKFSDGHEEDIDSDLAKIIFLPILIACSYNRAHSSASFHEEYIIPNLLLQWISKEKSQVSGISYLSTKTHQMRHCNLGINFVFPPETYEVTPKGYCQDLSDSFELSKPVSWQLLDTVNTPKIENEVASAQINNMEGDYLSHYKGTKFYSQELKLKNMKVGNVNSGE
jgi:hypothetical protein